MPPYTAHMLCSDGPLGSVLKPWSTCHASMCSSDGSVNIVVAVF